MRGRRDRRRFEFANQLRRLLQRTRRRVHRDRRRRAAVDRRRAGARHPQRLFGAGRRGRRDGGGRKLIALEAGPLPGLPQRKTRAVLFLSASVGEGHTAAAQAVCAAVLSRSPETRCQVVDSYRYASQVFHKVASNGYIGMVKMLPQLYRYIYDQAERATKVSAFKSWLHHYTAVNLRQYVEDFAPDVVVCTHAFPCGVMAEYKREYPDAPPVVGVVTDFVVHPFWIHRNIDRYAVATPAMRQTLLARGVAAERIKLTGIP
ncbi:MAG: hypothetical protein GIW99_10325, partial [Candidatus Eremiobacteraeota bacterium]|nr:hypothetical protein [Candidatus Eremiobacteraeota bacterium]